jgi:hypothetical protein
MPLKPREFVLPAYIIQSIRPKFYYFLIQKIIQEPAYRIAVLICVLFSLLNPRAYHSYNLTNGLIYLDRAHILLAVALSLLCLAIRFYWCYQFFTIPILQRPATPYKADYVNGSLLISNIVEQDSEIKIAFTSIITTFPFKNYMGILVGNSNVLQSQQFGVYIFPRDFWDKVNDYRDRLCDVLFTE